MMSGREVLQDGCKTCYDVLFGDGGTNKKTGGAGGSGRVDNVKIFIASDQDECY